LLLPQLQDFIHHKQLLFCQPILEVNGSASFTENPIDILLQIKKLYYSSISFKEMRMYEEHLHFFIVIGEHNNQI